MLSDGLNMLSICSAWKTNIWVKETQPQQDALGLLLLHQVAGCRMDCDKEVQQLGLYSGKALTDVSCFFCAPG